MVQDQPGQQAHETPSQLIAGSMVGACYPSQLGKDCSLGFTGIKQNLKK
jgi:hypothetical protein